MIAFVAILAWLPMPLDPITSPHDLDWYGPVEIIHVDEPSLEEIERDLKRRNIRILEAGPECRE